MTKGERLKRLRELNQLSQEELAAKLSTTRQTIFKYEKGIVSNIPSDRIEQLATILGSTPEYILGWEDLPSNDDLSPSERQILELFRGVNGEGQEKILDYANYISSRAEYKKHNLNEVVV